MQPISKEYNTFAYVINGEGLFGPAEKQKIAKTGQMVVFDKDGEGVAFSVVQLLLIIRARYASNRRSSINEPGARYGPFVMNTNEEILQAAEDYRSGKMGETTIQ